MRMNQDRFAASCRCGGVSRRDWLKGGVAGVAGLLAGPTLAMPVPVVARPGKARAVIQIWMWGGPAHLDTFDPKPEAGSDYTGPLANPIETNVSGIRIGELLPHMAKQADKYAIIRGMTHGNNGHETASYMVQTGREAGGRLVYPAVGAVVAAFKGYGPDDEGGLLPPYIVLTEPQGRFSESGFLGSKYKPFATGGDPSRTPFAVEGVVSASINERRQRARRDLLHALDSFAGAMEGDPRLAAFERCEDEAYDLILGDAGKIFDLSTEEPALRDRYGRNRFGQSCLMARRLIERGVRYVTINYKGWDTHKQHFQAMRRQLPELDAGLATLLWDLSERGLLDSTIVWWGGEFGRTPKVQWESPWNGGRHHYGRVFSALLAGGGFQGGTVVGESDAKGQDVKDRPVYPWDMIGSIYQQLGIDPDGPLPHPAGLAVRATPSPTEDGVPSGGRLHEIM